MTTDDAPRTGTQNFFDTLRRSPVRRSTDDRWVGGVAAGLATRLGVDPLLVRVGLVVLGFLGGAGVVAYALAWLLLPDTDGRIEAEQAVRGDISGSTVAALALILVSGLVPTPWSLWWGPGPAWDGWGGPVLLTALVVAGLFWAAAQTGTLTGGAADRPTAERTATDHVATDRAPGSGTASSARPGTGTVPAPASKVPGPGPAATAAALGVALLVGGGVALGVAALEGTAAEVSADGRLLTAAAVTLVLGLATLLLGLAGRTDGAVGGFGLAAAVATVAFAAVPGQASVHVIGEARWAPAAVSEAEEGYAFGVGDARLDLSRLDLDGPGSAAGEELVVPVATGIGDLEIVVPDDVEVVVRTGAVIGSADAPRLPADWSTGGRTAGFLTDGSYTSPDTGGPGPRLVVDAHTLIGAIEVTVASR